ncbi:MAG: hypothetical protein WCP06_05285, partial [Verrucomicrobiota bacterium]
PRRMIRPRHAAGLETWFAARVSPGSRSGIPAASFQRKAAGSRFYYGAGSSRGAQVYSFPDE